jgi:hypothetical protein
MFLLKPKIYTHNKTICFTKLEKYLFSIKYKEISLGPLLLEFN